MDLGAFVAWLHGEIREALKTDGHCKRYEGEMDVQVDGALDSPRVRLTLRMYLFAPSGRQHEWTGATVAEACGKAHDDITRWIAEERTIDEPLCSACNTADHPREAHDCRRIEPWSSEHTRSAQVAKRRAS